MKRILSIFIICFLSLALFSQRNIELFTLAPFYGLPSKFEAPYQDYKAKPIGTLVNVKGPIPFNETFAWFNQLTYTSFNINNDAPIPAGIANPIHLHSFILQTGPVLRFGNTLDNKIFNSTVDQGIMVLFAPRFMTDFENASGENFQFGAVVLYQKIFSDNLMMRFGGMYHQEIGGPYMVPIIDTDWQINRKWSLVGMWPITGKVKYQVNDNFSTGISHFGLVTSYLLGHPDYVGDYIERTSIDLSLFGRIRVAGNFHLEGRVGYAVGRTYKQYSADQTAPFRLTIISFGEDTRVHKNYLFDPGIVLNLRFVYDLPLQHNANN